MNLIVKQLLASLILGAANWANSKWGIVLTPEWQAALMGVLYPGVIYVVHAFHFDENGDTLRSVAKVMVIGLLGTSLVACTSLKQFEAMTPAQKYTTVCNEYWAGKDQLGPMIQAVANINPISAEVYLGATVALDAGCLRDGTGAYVFASNSIKIADLLPQLMQAAGRLTTLFIK